LTIVNLPKGLLACGALHIVANLSTDWKFCRRESEPFLTKGRGKCYTHIRTTAECRRFWSMYRIWICYYYHC